MLLANAKPQLLVPPSVEPLSLADAKDFLRLETTGDDARVEAMVAAARHRCETLADRSFITQTWKLTLDYLPFSSGSWGYCQPGDFGVDLPRPPLIAVQSITYVDMGGNLATLDPGGPGLIVSPGVPGRIFPSYGSYFPLSQPRPSAVEIVYTAGYGPNPGDVPEPYIQAIAILTAFLYENRSLDAPIPRAVEFLIDSVAGRSYA